MSRFGSASVIALALSLPGVALAQSAPVVSHPVVQAVPQQAPGMRLNDALGRLARNPQDIEALIEAGQASLELGDSQAAIGFYQRALAIQPGNARTKAGLAGAYVLSEDPFTAIELFDDAEKAGPIDPARLADRGLAFDLVGDSRTAQYFYRQSLAAAPNDETLRRLALSLAIDRDRKGMDQALAPLLQKQDKAAWRTRAFGLAIMGQTDEAEAIARQTMPADMASAITAYLRYMPRLTAAQQAAAGNLGHFPRAAEIGHDDPRLAAYSRSRVQVAAASPAPAPVPDKGKRKDDKNKRKDDKAKVAAAPVPPPEVQVGREATSSPVKLAVATPAPKPAPAPPPPSPAPSLPPPVPKPSAPPIAPPPAPPPPPVVTRPASLATAPANPVAAPVTQSPGPGFATLDPGAGGASSSFDLAKATPAPSPPPAPAPAPPPPPAPPAPKAKPKPASVDDVFADFTPPSREVEVQSGAVDVRKVRPVTTPAKDKDKAKDAEADKAKGKDAKPAAPSQPSRIWVQVATGRDKAALGFDWRKMAKDDPAIFKGQKPYITAWGQSNRLLAGPFDTAKEANAFLAQLKKAGVAGAFVWTSPAGQVVDALAGGK